MKIALDYDGTYTADPELWDLFIKNAHRRGHTVTIVTMRHSIEKVHVMIDCIYTGRKAKKTYCENKNIKFDIWIDDNPEWLLVDSI